MTQSKFNLSVHGIIPLSNLARYGNFEYDLVNERTFSFEDWSYDFSVIQDSDGVEPWLLDGVQEECLRLVSPELLEQAKPIPSYLIYLPQKTNETNNDNSFPFDLLPTSIDEVVTDEIDGDEDDELFKSCGLRCNINSSSLCQNITSIFGESSSSIWKPCGMFQQCEKCVKEPLTNCRASNVFESCKDRQYLNTTKISGAFFSTEWQLPQVVDPTELQEALLVCTWKTGIKQHRECNQAKPSRSWTSESDVEDEVELFISLEEFNKIRGLPIPVHIKALKSYNSINRDCGKGANLHNLILLSPQSSRKHGERAWWHCYGAVNKSTSQDDLSIQKEHKTNKTGTSSKRLYSDVVLKTSPSKQANDGKLDPLALEHESSSSSLESSEIYFSDTFNRSLEGKKNFSPKTPHNTYSIFLKIGLP